MLRISKFALLVRYIQEQFCKPAYKLLLHVPSSALSRKKVSSSGGFPIGYPFQKTRHISRVTTSICPYLTVQTSIGVSIHPTAAHQGNFRLLLTSSAITGGPVRTYPIYLKFSSATPKPSSICLSSFPLSKNCLFPHSQLLQCVL